MSEKVKNNIYYYVFLIVNVGNDYGKFLVATFFNQEAAADYCEYLVDNYNSLFCSYLVEEENYEEI